MSLPFCSIKGPRVVKRQRDRLRGRSAFSHPLEPGNQSNDDRRAAGNRHLRHKRHKSHRFWALSKITTRENRQRVTMPSYVDCTRRTFHIQPTSSPNTFPIYVSVPDISWDTLPLAISTWIISPHTRVIFHDWVVKITIWCAVAIFITLLTSVFEKAYLFDGWTS